MGLDYGRRSVLAGIPAAGVLLLFGCSAAGEGATSGQAAAPDGTGGAPRNVSMTVYRDPSCGCCTAWAEIARKEGFQPNVVDEPDMPALKARLGVPSALLSCHTTLVGGYVVEGHVPLADVHRLLAKQPSGLKGIGVAGMPMGSPGMEVPDGRKEPFNTMAFDAGGRVISFAL